MLNLETIQETLKNVGEIELKGLLIKAGLKVNNFTQKGKLNVETAKIALSQKMFEEQTKATETTEPAAKISESQILETAATNAAKPKEDKPFLTDRQICQNKVNEINQAITQGRKVLIGSKKIEVLRALFVPAGEIVQDSKFSKPSHRDFVELLAVDKKPHGYWSNAFHFFTIEPKVETPQN